MKKLTVILLVALLVPAAGVIGQMQWHEKDGDKEVVIFEGKAHGMDTGKGRGMHGDKMMSKRGHGGHGIMAMADELGLSDDQKEQIKKLALGHKLASVDNHAAVKKAEITLKAMMHDGDSDQGKVFAAIDKLFALKADVKKASWSHHEKVKGLLTDEQRDKMKELKHRSGNVMFFGEPGEHGKNKVMRRKVIEIEDDG
ncbi:MAG: Spy/CpxP family protein refolding chaperone [candidate division Zixibacteria bacterium]|nr:Spy/CpxP family protein refolding chaperone [candidate division Zixibacteria bacterium]MDH3937113.1 Spy/CpxP family protein refolding chaperone [candidate division Zixibacteria bacterium]MDH4033034.1 Spy/CpxP family protein refolding chaperone [candidate division Zixibacteria bacterium]